MKRAKNNYTNILSSFNICLFSQVEAVLASPSFSIFYSNIF